MSYKIGTRIEKCNTSENDGHKDGDKGTVISSMNIPAAALAEIKGKDPNIPKDYTPQTAYFVIWDDMQGIPVGVVDYRVKESGEPRVFFERNEVVIAMNGVYEYLNSDIPTGEGIDYNNWITEHLK